MEKFYYSEKYKEDRHFPEAATGVAVERMEKLRVSQSQNLDLNQINQLLGYRRRVAEDVVSCAREDHLELLYESLDHCNDQIRKYLGL
jgi:hypothetical protein